MFCSDCCTLPHPILNLQSTPRKSKHLFTKKPFTKPSSKIFIQPCPKGMKHIGLNTTEHHRQPRFISLSYSQIAKKNQPTTITPFSIRDVPLLRKDRSRHLFASVFTNFFSLPRCYRLPMAERRYANLPIA